MKLYVAIATFLVVGFSCGAQEPGIVTVHQRIDKLELRLAAIEAKLDKMMTAKVSAQYQQCGPEGCAVPQYAQQGYYVQQFQGGGCANGQCGPSRGRRR